jgi:hypothetical protein
MRAVLIATIKSRAVYRSAGIDWPADIDPLSPLFQMSSDTTHDALADAYAVYPDDPLLSSLISATGSNPTGVLDAVQPLICAFTHSSEGLPKRVFTHAHGNAGETLPMPGGHGQCFAVLAEIFRSLLKSGKRFVTIGNVDNLGYLVDPCEVAVLALSGKQAGFDFSFRTPVDVKGGILVRDQHGRLNCADIGPAISKDDVARAESAGKPILFNTAAGIFDLDYLVENLDRIVTDLPVRFSDQDKDAGRYSQAEQVTWEVLGMLDDFVVFSVEKWRRFLAAKLLLETLMTSGVHLDDPRYPTSDDPVHDLRSTARHLNRGLSALLAGPYGMKETGGAWAPVPTETIVAESETEGV